MAKPPPDTPSSDIEGVNRDARAGAPSNDSSKDPGSQIENAGAQSAGRPAEQAPDADKGG